MKIEKRNYVKPYTAVMNVQTEGVIATSGEEIVTDDLCKYQYIFSNWGSSACQNEPTCDCTYEASQCNSIKGFPAKTCYKDKGKIYHIDLQDDGYYHIFPCNCNK